MFHPTALLFYYESWLSESSFETTVCVPLSPQDRRSIHIVPPVLPVETSSVFEKFHEHMCNTVSCLRQ